MTITSTRVAAARGVGAGIGWDEKKVLAATLVGTTIEWYDFFVYARLPGSYSAHYSSGR